MYLFPPLRKKILLGVCKQLFFFFMGNVSSTIVESKQWCSHLLCWCPTPLHQSSGSRRNQCCLIGDVFSLPRVKFLSKVLARKISPEVVTVVVKGLRHSSLRQYESCWKAFWSISVGPEGFSYYSKYSLKNICPSCSCEKEGGSDYIYTFVSLGQPASF